MPDIVKFLKDEVSRLARKEIRSACDPLYKQLQVLKKTVRDQRDTIAKHKSMFCTKSLKIV